MTMRYFQSPILFIGYNTDQRIGTFTLATVDNKVVLIITKFRTADIFTNYSSPSMIDFKNCRVSINCSFGFPTTYKVGDKIVPVHTTSIQNEIHLSIDNLSIISKKQKIELKSLSKVGGNKFETKWEN